MSRHHDRGERPHSTSSAGAADSDGDGSTRPGERRETDRVSRRAGLRAVAALGATGGLAGLSGCQFSFDLSRLRPQGQAVVYRTTGGDLRAGTLNSLTVGSSGSVNVTPDVENDQFVASVGGVSGRVSLSPDGTAVAYVGTNQHGLGTELVVRSLPGGTTRHTRQDLARYWGGSPANALELGNLRTLDWCRRSGSDAIALNVEGGSELPGQLLFEFTRGRDAVSLFRSVRVNVVMPGVDWSPSCDRLVYKRAGSLTADLSVLDVAAGTSSRRIANGRDPVWGATGIAFVRNGNVYLDRGSGAVRLTASSATDINLVIFEQGPGESLAFRRGSDMYLIERIDQLGPTPNPSPTRVRTAGTVTTFDIVA